MSLLSEVLTVQGDLLESRLPVTPEYVAKIRKDFLVLMKNVGRVNSVETLDTFRDAVLAYQSLIEKIFNVCKEALSNIKFRAKYDHNSRLESDAQYLLDNAKDLWALERELGPPGSHKGYYQKYPDTYTDPLVNYLYGFKNGSQKWDSRVRRVAPKAWKWLESAASIAAQDQSPGSDGAIVVDHGAGSLMDIEGFHVRLDQFSGSKTDVEGLGRFRAGLKTFRELAKQKLPELLRNVPGFVLNFAGDPKALQRGADWTAREINFSFFALHEDPRRISKTVAHELLHGIYELRLSDEARKAWNTFVMGQTMEIDLREVLKDIGDDAMTFEPDVYKDDPIKWLQVTSFNYDRTYHFEYGRDIRKWLSDGGDPVVRVTRLPVTAYGAKNPEETFCEAGSLIVAYGPRAVLPEVRHMLGMLLPRLKFEGRARSVCDLRDTLVEAKETSSTEPNHMGAPGIDKITQKKGSKGDPQDMAAAVRKMAKVFGGKH